ncbi:hypothetical protein GLAREA_08915 [Glarea lozoyensis ATCC 20868]|uniref:Mitochondrial splicing suppressor 51-like C-terminal domain-containing protein n=1 Tax=Glarea lozoyensis (strain ATCC 20868 / MF5171) TaxID=1116229 RepID=S3DEB3_GLAL2|nr:uncharacterized protein GLAREA_08915 [Glarea lozoyensis ATCC 20868]EPE36752.1 hypothetical protein GLAREA_08915 [Glarea lozoyensis ATCC 20868]
MVRARCESETAVSIIRRQPYCIQCYRSGPQLPSGSVLTPCKECYLVSTCTTCPSTLPPHECPTYQRVGSLENFRIAHFTHSGQVYAQAPTDSPRKHYRKLSTAKNWYEYFSSISDKKEAVENVITPSFDLNLPLLAQADAETQKSLQRLWLYLTLATETQSMPLTILAALELTIPSLATKTELTIHLIGAGAKELQNLLIFEELLHLLPSLKTLKLVFAGPECKNSGATPDDPVPEMQATCCPDCTKAGRKRVMALCSEVYHSFASMPQWKRPDLAVLFHSGRSQDGVEGWKPTTEWLVNSGIPTVCTTYTEREAREEVGELEALGARFVRGVEVNGWRSLVHRLEPMEGGEHGFYFDNFWWYVFEGRE